MRHPRPGRDGSWVITTHDVADFDAIASCFAAQRLHPEAQVLRRRLVGTSERAFLALHKDRFASVPFENIDQDAVRGWVVVDMRRRSRLGDFERLLQRFDAHDPDLEVHVWDHHAASPDDLTGQVEHVEPVGAATTLLIEEMRARDLSVDSAEATLYALGIHADTGSLTYATTTPRDAEAIAWLMHSGARVSVLDRYLRPALDEKQRAVLVDLLSATVEHRVGGVTVAVSVVSMPKATSGLSVITSQAQSVGSAEAFFALFVIRDRSVQVVGRSNRSVLDVGAIMRELGGGGHAEAGSAKIKGQTADAVCERIFTALAVHPPKPQTVRELMSSPVRTIEHDESLAEAEVHLAAWRHTGAPVFRDGKLVGVLSGRDIERANAAGDTHVPASSRMTSPPRTVDAEASLEEALAIMSKHDIGRLPVVESDELVGIVSRTDILRALYGAAPG
jgi:tRNA nucleotidyltransferase (CCA-adding enzyme)